MTNWITKDFAIPGVDLRPDYPLAYLAKLLDALICAHVDCGISDYGKAKVAAQELVAYVNANIDKLNGILMLLVRDNYSPDTWKYTHAHMRYIKNLLWDIAEAIDDDEMTACIIRINKHMGKPPKALA